MLACLVAARLLPDEAGYVDVREGGHQVLAVESIHDAAVSGDGAGKVLQQRHSRGTEARRPSTKHVSVVGDTGRVDAKRYLYFEGSLEAASEEATEGPDERRKGGEEDAVDLEGVKVDRFLEETTARHESLF